MDSSSWETPFRELYERVRKKVQGGERNLDRLFIQADRSFLHSIGSKPIEVFDAADDFVRDGAPTFEDILEIHRMRFQYFQNVQKGVFPPLVTEFRAKQAEIGGIPWLPRAIDKARAKLRGQLVDDFFYPCAGDRGFLKKIGMSVPDFFRLVRDSSSDEEVLRGIPKR